MARLGCALRGAHAYAPSRKLEGYETCVDCGHRRKAEQGPWFAETPAAQGSSPDAGHGAAQGDSRLRPLAMVGCAIRGYHNFLPSRRFEGYDTCVQCGYRKKISASGWFATPAPKNPSQAAIDAGPVRMPERQESEGLQTEADPGPVPMDGVDPRVLRDFLRQIDSGPAAPASRRRGRHPPAD